MILLIKEALHNVVKHSEAKLCTIEVNQNREGLQLVVRDDGQGFDMEHKSNGYGLKSMTQRARKMNAVVTINSKLNKGTEVSISMPSHPNGL